MEQVYFELIKYHRMTIDGVPAVKKDAVQALLAEAGLDGNGNPLEVTPDA